jgi:hypothetical protein
MTGSITIAPRFCGPPNSGNGGYVCGLIAGYLDEPAEITLRLPPPLNKRLAVEMDDQGSVRVADGDSLIAEATSLAGNLGLQLPAPVSVTQAQAASAQSPLRLHPEAHPFPTCFVCGPQREPDDGLRICVGPVPSTELWADVWYPGAEFADAAGHIRPEFVWAALDCPGGVAALQGAVTDGNMYLLGRLAACQYGPVAAGEPHVVVGWRVAAQGRKVLAGSALFAGSGQAVAAALATWIGLQLPTEPRADSPAARRHPRGPDAGDVLQRARP